MDKAVIDKTKNNTIRFIVIENSSLMINKERKESVSS